MCLYEHRPLIECWGQVVEGDRNRIMSQKGHLTALLKDPRDPFISIIFVYFSHHMSNQHTEFNLVSQWKEGKHYLHM